MTENLHVRCVVCGEVLSYTPINTAPLLQHLRSKHPCLSVACLKNNDDIRISSSKESQSSNTLSYSTDPKVRKQQTVMAEPGEVNNKSKDADAKQGKDDPRNPSKQSTKDDPSKQSNKDKNKNPSKPDSKDDSDPYKALPDNGTDENSKYNTEGNQKAKGRTVFSTTVETVRPGSPSLLCYNCGHNSQPIQRRSLKKSSYSSLGALCLLGCWPSCFLPFLTCSKRDSVNLYCAQCNAFLGTLDQKSKVITKSGKSKGDNDPTINK